VKASTIAAAAGPQTTGTKGPGAASAAGQITVLLADSDTAARHMLRRVLLREFKSVVVEVDNGISALELIDAGGVDAVVLDLKMPALNGLEVLRDIRESSRHRWLPVVVVTEQKDELAVKEAVTLGVADYVLKDQHQAVVIERLRRVFSSDRHLGTARAQSGGGNWTKTLSSAFTILVVDEDQDFRHFCTDVFRSEYEVTTTASAAQAMGLAMTQTYNAILVGSSVGTMSQVTFARRLRQIERVSSSRLVAVVPKREVKAMAAMGLFDRIAVRTFVPETFLRQFEHFLKPSGVLAKVATAIPGFRSQTISAVEQVFGMMLGTEVNILPAPPPHPSDGVSVAVPLTLAEQTTEMVVTATVGEKTGLELAARMMQSPANELPADAASGALGEILNMVGGRVQHALTNHGLRAHIGLPATGKATEAESDAMVLGFAFESLNGELQEFSFSVSEREASQKDG
jgi:two-component system chemotaxis response regulator CheY